MTRVWCFRALLLALLALLALPERVALAQGDPNRLWIVWINEDRTQCTPTRNTWMAVSQDNPGASALGVWNQAPGYQTTFNLTNALAQLDTLRLEICFAGSTAAASPVTAGTMACPNFQDYCCPMMVWSNPSTGARTIVNANVTPGAGFTMRETEPVCCEDAAAIAGFDPFSCTTLALTSVPGAIVGITPNGPVALTGPVAIPTSPLSTAIPALATSPAVDAANACEYANNGQCDEPIYCALGTDMADCSASVSVPPQDSANSCTYAHNGQCDEPSGYCAAGTDTDDCAAGPGDIANSCNYAYNGQCDEPTYCATGTDADDCAAGPGDIANSCDYAYNGQCDESAYCATGTDSQDCATGLGQGDAAGCTALWNGTWNSSYGDMTISAGGGSLQGSYVSRDDEPAPGRLNGTLSPDGCNFTGTWESDATPNHSAKSGEVSLSIAGDGMSWSGSWNYGPGKSGGGWRADRIGQRP